MDDNIRIKKLLGNSNVLINRVRETVKHKLKKQKGGFCGMLLGI